MSAAGASRAHEGDRGAHRADGDRESGLGLQPHPGCVAESRPPCREKHCRHGSKGHWDPAGARAAFIVAYLYAGALGRDCRCRLLHDGSVDCSRVGDLPHAVFVLDLKSRRVEIVGSTRNPDAAFMGQAARRLMDAVDGFLARHRVLICDRDAKWTDRFRAPLEGAGVRGRLSKRRTPTPTRNGSCARFGRNAWTA